MTERPLPMPLLRAAKTPSKTAAAFGWGLLVVSLSALGCGASPPPPATQRAVPSGAPPREAAPRWALVELVKVPATLELFDPAGWRKASVGSFTVIEHGATHSTLSLRVTRASRLARPAECEAEARLARPTLPRVDPELVVERQELRAPEGFNGWVVVGVEPATTGGARGFALAVGAAVGRCFVAAFDTEASEPNAAEVVADRLHLAADRLLPSVRLSEIDERVRVERELK